MKSSPSVAITLKPFTKILSKFHFIIFFVILAGGVGYCVLTLNNILEKSSDTSGYTSSLTVTTFDTTTIGKLTNLKTSTDATIDTSLPAGRINPFTE